MAHNKFNALPGFGLTMGFALLYLSGLVLLPLAARMVRACQLSWADVWHLATTDRAPLAFI